MTSAAAPADAEQSAAPAEFDLDAGWRLHPGVALRPEPFGALLYHFHTRKLSFLKSPTIVEVVRTLADHPTARAGRLRQPARQQGLCSSGTRWPEQRHPAPQPAARHHFHS